MHNAALQSVCTNVSLFSLSLFILLSFFPWSLDLDFRWFRVSFFYIPNTNLSFSINNNKKRSLPLWGEGLSSIVIGNKV